MRYYEYEDATGIPKYNEISFLNVTPDNGILAVGQIQQQFVPGGVQAMWIMHLDSLGCVEKDCDPTLGFPDAFCQKYAELAVYPNPASNICYIRIPEEMEKTGNNYFLLQLFNSQGVLVQQTRRKDNEEIISLETGHLPPGLYLLQLTDGHSISGQTKLLIQR